MIQNIENDLNRFRQIVRGKIKENLKKYISRGELVGRKGKDLVSIPVPRIDLPSFRFGDNGRGGAGQGDGEPGDPLSGGQEGDGQGQAGDEPGRHVKEVEISIEELAEIMGEELGLPRIEPKGKKEIVTLKDKYSGISRVGPESLRHYKRTFKAALKRQIMTGHFNRENPIIVPVKDDFRYRTWKTIPSPQTNAAILYIMDVSGSMGDEQKEIVRTESFWIDTWLQSQYKGLETRYIIHDARAAEVDRETFFTTRESGGTVISTSYEVAREIIRREFPAEEWNIYIFQFSDGDNWSKNDNEKCLSLLKEEFIPIVNLFGYGQVDSPYGSGEFYTFLKDYLTNEPAENVILSKIEGKEHIYQSIKDFLGSGK